MSNAAENAPDCGCVSCVMLRETVLNNVTLARNSEDDLRIETCRSDLKCFNVKILCMRISWCAD